MKESIENIELFDAYVKGELSESASHELEKRFETEKDLAESFETYKRSIDIVKIQGFKEEVIDWFQDQEKRSQQRFWPWMTGIAASLTIIISIVLWQLRGTKDNLFEAYYEPYPNVVSMRGNNGLYEGMEAYSSGDFDLAAKLLNEVDHPSDTILFYLGLSYMETNRFQLALGSLQRLDANSIFYPHGIWYTSLIYVKLEDKTSATKTIEKIGAGDFNYEASRELLKKLD